MLFSLKLMSWKPFYKYKLPLSILFSKSSIITNKMFGHYFLNIMLILQKTSHQPDGHSKEMLPKIE